MATLLLQEEVPPTALRLPSETVAATRTRDQVILSLANAWKRVVAAGPRRSPSRLTQVTGSADSPTSSPVLINNNKFVLRQGQTTSQPSSASSSSFSKRWPHLTRHGNNSSQVATTPVASTSTPSKGPRFWDKMSPSRTTTTTTTPGSSPAPVGTAVPIPSDFMMGSHNAHTMLLSMQDFLYNTYKNMVLQRLLEDDHGHHIQTLPAGEFAVHKLLRSRVSQTDDAPVSAFYLVDLALVVRQVTSWRQNLPLIEATFSITANADTMILKAMATLGVKLCCSSKGDLEALHRVQAFSPMVQDMKPCKTPSHLAAALTSGVRTLTVDSTDEVSRIAHKAKAMGIPPQDLSLMVLMRGPEERGFTLGASMDDLAPIITAASSRSLRLVGIMVDTRHFVVNDSGRKGYLDGPVEAMLSSAVLFARRCVDLAMETNGTQLTKVHLFGLEKHLMGSMLQAHIGFIFPPTSGVSFSIDATQHLLDNSTTLTTKIIGKRASATDGSTPMGFHYYLDDGCYGSLGDIFLRKKKLIPNALFSDMDQENQSALFPTTLWGPTCDGLDCIDDLTTLPELSIGDWIYFRNVGNLAFSSRTNFNGLEGPKPMYCFSGVSYNM